jgi:hypothetical protein
MGIQLLADPWWVNLAVLVPIVAYVWWRRTGLALGSGRLVVLAVWSVAFGFVEAAVVVYLRGIYAVGSGLAATRADIARISLQLDHPLVALPADLLTIEVWREAATMVMLVGIALVAAQAWRERIASLLWAFAIWDICYYGGLWLTVGWPSSLATQDVLFLIPRPWIAAVWLPLLVSGLTLVVIVVCVTSASESTRRRRRSTVP